MLLTDLLHGNTHLAVRQMQSRPLLTSMYKLMQEKEHTLSKKCRLGDAFRYIRKHWAALCNFCDDGLAEVDHNAAERALRAVCLGKKNYVFFGSDHGGERGALLYGLIGERYRSGSVSAPYPECTARMVFQPC